MTASHPVSLHPVRPELVEGTNSTQGKSVKRRVSTSSARTDVRCAFVSTNSVTQGEQVGLLWGELLHKYQCKIHFAYRTFKWSNDARGKAAVHCVIISFAPFEISEKRIWDYEKPDSDALETKVNNINPYLVDAPDVALTNRRQPIESVPEIIFGNMPNDGGHLLLTNDEKIELLREEPATEKFIRPFMSGKEFLNNEARWCLWLVDISTNDLLQLPEVLRRVAAVKQLRQASDRASTRELATFPTLFGKIRQPNSAYILLPRVSSETRRYIPFGFFDKNCIVSDTCLAIPNATLFHFGVLTSAMHMAWVRYTCGRLKSDYRYSAGIVYNNYPWPEALTDKQRNVIEAAAQAVLDARALFPQSSLAKLYNPVSTPPALSKAHQKLDGAVDASYRKAAFENDAQRVVFLFERYQQLTSLLPPEKKSKQKK